MKFDTRFLIYITFLLAILLSLVGTFSESSQIQDLIKIGLFMLKLFIAFVLGSYIYKIKKVFWWSLLALLVFLPFGFILALLVFFWLQKGRETTNSTEQTLTDKQQVAHPKKPLKEALWGNAIMALPPSLLLLFANFSATHTSFLSVAPFLYAFLLPIVLLISLYPSFSKNMQRRIWLLFSILIPVLLIGSLSLIGYMGAEEGTGGALYAVLLIVLLAPLFLFIIYAILAGYVLRKVLYATQQKQLWLGAAVLTFFFPFLMWYGAPPVLNLLGDGLVQLSDLLLM